MAIADGRGQSLSQQTGMLTAHITTPSVPVVIRLAVAALPGEGGNGFLTLDSKTLREQLNVDLMEELRARVLSHGELAESEHTGSVRLLDILQLAFCAARSSPFAGSRVVINAR